MRLTLSHIAALAVLMATCLPAPTWAHPHVWGQTVVTALVSGTQLLGYEVSWEFDEMYSESFMMEADTNRNGTLEAPEAQAIVHRVFVENPAPLRQFFLVETAGKKQPFKLAKPRIWVDDKKLLRYNFIVQLNQPQPLETHHRFTVYDPEWYIEFIQEPQIKAPQNCISQLRPDTAISLYFDMVNPEVYSFACGQAAKR